MAKVRVYMLQLASLQRAPLSQFVKQFTVRRFRLIMPIEIPAVERIE